MCALWNCQNAMDARRHDVVQGAAGVQLGLREIVRRRSGSVLQKFSVISVASLRLILR